jgi:predicted class III extradiol MEMO1 family dioxygenase
MYASFKVSSTVAPHSGLRFSRQMSLIVLHRIINNEVIIICILGNVQTPQ